MDLVSLNMKATIIRQEKDEKFFTRTELVTVYGNIISGKYANEVNKVREEFPLTFLHNGPKFNELDSVKKFTLFRSYLLLILFQQTNIKSFNIRYPTNNLSYIYILHY